MEYLKYDERRESILKVATQLSEDYHYKHVTRAEIAARANTATGNVSRIFGSMTNLQDAIVKRAISEENLLIIGQALSVLDPLVETLSPSLKMKAVSTLA